MKRMNIKLQIAKDTSELKLNDMSGTLTIEAALKQAKRNFNKINGLHQIIKEIRGEDNEKIQG